MTGWASAGTTNGQWRNFNAIRSNTHMTPSESTQTIGGGGYMLQDKIYVDPIPSQYIVPSGTYTVGSSGTHDVTNYASASVAAGTEGTPTATKGTVSNHSISFTPSVTNSAGWVAGGTHSGVAVSVSAAELVSGSETKTANGTYDVTNLATLVVDFPDGDSLGYGSQSSLAGTTWLINASPAAPLADSVYSVEFASNNASYARLLFTVNGADFSIMYGVDMAYYRMFGMSVWQNEAYRTVQFTGGADATNPDLIAWLEANATQQ